MHDCPGCGEACDCDGEDHHQSAPDDCEHACDLDDEDLDELLDDDPDDVDEELEP